MQVRRALVALAALGMSVCVSACGEDATGPEQDAGTELREGPCMIEDGEAPDSLPRIDCRADLDAMSSQPLDDSIPGARSVKVVLDRRDDDRLYFQNSQKYTIHYDFVSEHLSGGDLPLVTSRAEFNQTEYFKPDRRFVLGSVTHYEGPDAWVLELAPYDTADKALLETLFEKVQSAAYFGQKLAFHPGSEALEALAKTLPDSIPVITTDDLYAGTSYQPLNLGEAIGKLRFMTADELATTYVGFREIIVLDRVPNDISVVAALITEELQTPLAHVNVLAQNRKTPNMGLRGAMTNAELRALEGKWVKLVVDSFDYSVTEASQDEADAFWEARKPAPITLPDVDMTVSDLRDIEDVTAQATGEKVTRDALRAAARAFGAKAANYSVLARIDGVPVRKAFAIPASWYMRFMEDHGFFEQVDTLLADDAFQNDPAVRDAKLRELRDAIKAAPLDEELDALLREKLETDYPGESMRFRSSTNAEDLDGFPCAGCYDSHTGDPSNWEGDVLRAVKQTWSTVWKFRTFEERAYHGIDHKTVGMGLLVHHNFPDEEANGVAITANPYDPSGLSPGFYVNVQSGGDAEVVAPPAGVTSDSFIYQYDFPGTPTIYLTRSNLIDEGTTVLEPTQVHALGRALDAIHTAFISAYGPGVGVSDWYAMDVEFKFDDEAAPGQPPSLWIKQARPYAGRGEASSVE